MPASREESTAHDGHSDIFSRLTDPSGYTGTHKHRFDPSTGDGRGILGRDSPAKATGHLLHYPPARENEPIRSIAQITRLNLHSPPKSTRIHAEDIRPTWMPHTGMSADIKQSTDTTRRATRSPRRTQHRVPQRRTTPQRGGTPPPPPPPLLAPAAEQFCAHNVAGEVVLSASWLADAAPYSSSVFNPTGELDLVLMQYDGAGDKVVGGAVDRENNRTEWRNSGGASGWLCAATNSGDLQCSGSDMDGAGVTLAYQQLAITLDDVAPNVHDLFVGIATRGGTSIQTVARNQLKLVEKQHGESQRALPLRMPSSSAGSTSTGVGLLFRLTRADSYEDTTGWLLQPLGFAATSAGSGDARLTVLQHHHTTLELAIQQFYAAPTAAVAMSSLSSARPLVIRVRFQIIGNA